MHQTLNELEDTERLAQRIARQLMNSSTWQDKPGAAVTLALCGTLGAGKTQFARFLCAALGVASEQVTSPTYVLLQRYTGRATIYHFDFYRLENEAQVWDLGIDELYEQPLVILIEWADKFPQCLPDDYLEIKLELDGNQLRSATLTPHGSRTTKLVASL